MNKKGFTVVELCVTFSLVSIIAIMLFQLIFSLKELYVSGDIKTTLLNKQGIMTKKIYDDLDNKTLTNITACGISCLTFNYEEGSVQLLIDVAAGIITYDDYSMKLNKGSEIGEVKFDFSYSNTITNKNNSVFTIDIPISTKLLDDDFGIHITKIYNSSELLINNNISLNDATIIANGIVMDLSKITDDPSAIFGKIFHQENGTYYTNYEEFIKSKDEHKLSTLKSLEVFRSTNKNEELKNVALEGITNEKEIKKINENFQKGYFELILDYPGITAGVGSLQNFNYWTQTSNFINESILKHGSNIDSIYPGGDATGRWLSGLKYKPDENSNSYVSGSGGSETYFAIGMKEGNALLGPTGEVPLVEIWVRVNEYIDKYKLCTLVE